MKINPMSTTNITNKYRDTTPKLRSTAMRPMGYDKVEFSDVGKTFGAALRAAREVADVNMEAVNRVKEQINDGTYQVSPQEIAARMLNGILGGR